MTFDALSRSMALRPGRHNLALLLAISALLPSFLIWAAWTELDNITRGEGRLVAAAQNQIVQASESGVLLRRLVEENDVVVAGQILFELDPIDAESELNALLQRQAAADLRVLRLRAERDATPLEIPAALAKANPDIAASEASLFSARQSDLSGALQVLDEQLRQREEELASARNAQASAQNRVTLIEAELASIAPLVEENIAPTQRLLELRLSLEAARVERADAQSAIAMAEAAIRQVKREQSNRREAFALRANEELTNLLPELATMEESLPLLRERLSRTQIKAPMDGIVNRLNIRTPGGYVSSGTALLEIVPTGEDLVVEVKIAPRDISAIAIGNDARVRFDAYDAARYGDAEGTVTRISADAQVDPTTPSLRYYTVEVALTGRLPRPQDGSAVRLLPGMTTTVDVLSGKRSVLAYIWQPVAKVQDLALRD